MKKCFIKLKCPSLDELLWMTGWDDIEFEFKESNSMTVC